jgi:hypothetical protein
MRTPWISAAIGAGLGAGILVLATASAAAFGGDADDEQAAWAAKAKQAWTKTCQKCHTVPDARFETGRAWLHQVKETS